MWIVSPQYASPTESLRDAVSPSKVIFTPSLVNPVFGFKTEIRFSILKTGFRIYFF